MIQKLKPGKVFRYETKLNDLNEQIQELTAIFDIDLAVSSTNGAFNSANNVKTINSTHTAILGNSNCELRESDLIETCGKRFQIDFINDFGKIPILYLKLVDSING